MNKRKREHITIVQDSEKNTYSHGLQLYFEIPPGTTDIISFGNLGVERFHRLMVFEAASNEGFQKYSTDWTKYIEENFSKRYSLPVYQTDTEEYEADHVSHYALRLAFCNSEKLWRWFIDREIEWFHHKYKHETVMCMKSFIVRHSDYQELSDQEKERIIEELKSCNSQESLEEPFYEVDFKECLDLVRGRKVYLCKGYAYLPLSNLCFCIMARYRTYMMKILPHFQKRNVTERAEPCSCIIDHIRNVALEELNAVGISNVYEDIKISNIDQYSKKNLPLCMRDLYESLKKNHHLKYSGRIQLGRFIKDIGINVEDALEFWKTEFLQKMTVKEFEKEYAYHIKHTYGLVGRKKEYEPQACRDIINDSVGPRECNGCPFKTFSKNSLARNLREDNIKIGDINRIIKHAEAGHCGLACREHYKSVHNTMTAPIINYPHQYFEESMKISENYLDDLF